MTIHRKIRVAATVLLALLLLVGVRKRNYEDASARFVEAVGTADAVLRSRHDLGVVEIASYLLWRDATAAFGRLTPWERRLVVPLPPLPLDDPRLGDFPELRGMSDTETMAEYHVIRRRIEGGPTVNAAIERGGIQDSMGDASIHVYRDGSRPADARTLVDFARHGENHRPVQ